MITVCAWQTFPLLLDQRVEETIDLNSSKRKAPCAKYANKKKKVIFKNL